MRQHARRARTHVTRESTERNRSLSQRTRGPADLYRAVDTLGQVLSDEQRAYQVGLAW
jgi:hypothetical protein